MTPPRSLKAIAKEIEVEWGTKIYFGAVPYLEAMHDLNTVQEYYGADSGRSVVMYFLANAQSWRGETARRVKAELNRMLEE